MSTLEILRFLHLLAMAVWIGGLITMAALMPAAKGAGVSREQLRAMARRFGKLTWSAMALAVVTGLAQLHALSYPLGSGRLHLKLGLVVAACAVALHHQKTARTATPKARRVGQMVAFAVSLGIVWAAVRL
jgi:uncharacterized membrane protein